MTTAPERTNRTLSILRYIETFWAEHGYAPSVRDIQRGCGISSTSVVQRHLERLQARGDIRREPEIARSITLPHNVPW